MRIALLVLVLLWNMPPLSGEAPEPQGSSRGRIEIRELPSRVFKNVRKLRIWLPPGYDSTEERDRRYPVLYLNDGQTLFETETSTFSGKEWQADETAERLLQSGTIQPIIIVGIDHPGRRERSREYLPYFDEFLSPKLPDFQGALYPEFVLSEVIPLIEREFRTAPGQKGIGGASYGALAALFTVIQRPGEFDYLLLESPSLYVDDAHILKEAARLTVWPRRISIGVGTNETGEPDCDPASTLTMTNREAVTDTERLKRLLERQGIEQSRLLLTIVPCAQHDEAAWAERLPRVLTFLFGTDQD